MVIMQKVEELIDKIAWDQFNGAAGFYICENMDRKNTYQVNGLICEHESGILMFSDCDGVILNNGYCLLARAIKDIISIEFSDSYRLNFSLNKSISITAVY